MYLQGIADQHVAHDIEQWIADKAAINHKPKKEDSAWLERVPWHFFTDTAYVLFTAAHMHTHMHMPDTVFTSIYADKKVNIPAWKMLPSYEKQHDIMLPCIMPGNYDATKPLKLLMYIVASRKQAEGNSARINICVDAKNEADYVGAGDLQHVSTDNIIIKEVAGDKGLELYILEVNMSSLTIKPHDLVTFMFSRIAPEHAQEYDQNVYLQSVVLTYEKS
jgi:hypothetical protein